MEVKAIPVFVVLGNWTDQGIRKITEAPKRDKSVHDMVNRAGGKMQIFYTMGKYDFVAIIKFLKMKMPWRFFYAYAVWEMSAQ